MWNSRAFCEVAVSSQSEHENREQNAVHRTCGEEKVVQQSEDLMHLPDKSLTLVAGT